MSCKKLADLTAVVFCIICVIFLFLYPSQCIEAAKDGLNTTLYVVLPSIFPFMVLTRYIINNNLHTKISKFIGKPFEHILKIDKDYSTLFILGCIGGYPIGAIAINQMLNNKEITPKDAENLIGFCNNASPMFVIGTIGTLMLQNTTYGFILYGIHLSSVIICAGLSCRLFNKKNIKRNTKSTCLHIKTSPVISSANSMVNISGYIIIFSVISKLITVLFKHNNRIITLVLCMLEITTGIQNITHSFLPEVLKLSIISAALGFSGLCVFFQSKSVFENEKISFVKYLISKSFIAFVSFIITFLTFKIILP